MISITKQMKTVVESHAFAFGLHKQQGQRLEASQRLHGGHNGIKFQLLLMLLFKVVAVALMPNATKTAAASTTLSITFTTEVATMALTMAPTLMATNDYKAHEMKKGPAALNATAAGAIDATTDFTFKINKPRKAAESRHVAATASSTVSTSPSITLTTKASITTTYIWRNMWTNTTTATKQSKSEPNIYNGGGNKNISANDPTAAFMASTIAITTSPTTALADTQTKTTTRTTTAATTATATNIAINQQQADFHQELFSKPKATIATIAATSITTTSLPPLISSTYASNIYTDLIQLESSLSPPSPNASNISFHQRCVSSRDSFADFITIVLYTIVCIVGLFGNTLVIYVVLRFSKMQTVTNIYILNLAIADECFLIGIPFLLYTMRICSWTFGEFMCKAYMVSTSITQFTSSIFLLIMSADRFIAVCHPIASPRYRTLHIAKHVSALAWLTSAVLMLPVILFASTVAQEDGLHYSCNIEWPERYKKHSGTTFILYTFLLGFATPLCFILCFYYLVIKKLHAVGRKHKSKEKKRSHRKVTRLVLTVITVYIMCWLPQWISQVALISSNPAQRDLSRFEVLIFLLIGCLAYSNSAMNPILYAFLSDNFRKSFSKAFTCMAGHEVNAQLQVEPSVFTKHGGSRRRSSKRLVAQTTQKTKATLHPNPTLGNNNSSTTTSSTATQNERNTIAVTSGMGTGSGSGSAMASTTTTTLTTSTGNSVTLALPPFHAATNGRANAENVMLVFDKEESVCATVIERRKSRHLYSGSTLQTDL